MRYRLFPKWSKIKTSAKAEKKELWLRRWTHNSSLPIPLTTSIRCLHFCTPVLFTASSLHSGNSTLCPMQCSRLADERNYENIVLHSQTVLLHQISLILLHNSDSNYLCHCNCVEGSKLKDRQNKKKSQLYGTYESELWNVLQLGTLNSKLK